jgi:hypothetical protein
LSTRLRNERRYTRLQARVSNPAKYSVKRYRKTLRPYNAAVTRERENERNEEWRDKKKHMGKASQGKAFFAFLRQ